MAKLTKKQEKQYSEIIANHHKIIRAKHSNNRSSYEEAVTELYNIIKENIDENIEK